MSKNQSKPQKPKHDWDLHWVWVGVRVVFFIGLFFGTVVLVSGFATENSRIANCVSWQLPNWGIKSITITPQQSGYGMALNVLGHFKLATGNGSLLVDADWTTTKQAFFSSSGSTEATLTPSATAMPSETLVGVVSSGSYADNFTLQIPEPNWKKSSSSRGIDNITLPDIFPSPRVQTATVSNATQHFAISIALNGNPVCLDKFPAQSLVDEVIQYWIIGLVGAAVIYRLLWFFLTEHW